jgi:Icc-related predicted phosphoesterase
METVEKPQLFLITGDMINRGSMEEYERVYNAMFGRINCPIVSCFGNNEFKEMHDQLIKKYPDIKFLDDDATMLQLPDKTTIGIVGTTGSLDTPTPWQHANIPNIEKIYEQRVDTVGRLLQRMRADIKIILIHYAPTYKTLEGNNPRFFGTLGSQLYENVINKQKPTMVIHGHAHRGLKQVWIDTVPVFNVSLPVNKQIVVINTEKDLKSGIAKFV